MTNTASLPISTEGPGEGQPISVHKAPALTFTVHAECSTTRARVSSLTLPHYTAYTPMFMPVGTQGTMKGVTPPQMEELGCQVILGNTYHLGMRPGEEVMRKVGGLHRFMNWNRGLLTDSGGFQMVSLLKLARITEEGVHFSSPHDGSPMMLTPEKSMEIQNAIGADIMMQLDDVVHTLTTEERVKEAMGRSVRWLDRCIEAHARPTEQNLFCIIQGGLNEELRLKCIKEMVKRDTPGIAIGGLSGGEEKDKFWRIVAFCTKHLPRNKPIYCMGIGYAEDLVVCSALGVDMFDCVFPTRTARFGHALTRYGQVRLTHSTHRDSYIPIEEDCPCQACRTTTRAHLHTLMSNKDNVGCHLISMHNISYQMRLMREFRDAVREDRLPQWLRQFCEDRWGEAGAPQWVVNALAYVGVDVRGETPSTSTSTVPSSSSLAFEQRNA